LLQINRNYIIKAFFDKLPLVGKKKRQFHLWKEIFLFQFYHGINCTGKHYNLPYSTSDLASYYKKVTKLHQEKTDWVAKKEEIFPEF